MSSPASRSDYTLEGRWTLESGARVLSGNQAIALALLAQGALDRRANLKTAGYVSGYRGSPLGTLDATLLSIQDRIQAANIVFQPGVNEDLAASAIRGTQQIATIPGPRYDGVFAAWYGKGPGVDRSGDAFKHGNYAGAHARGGVALFYGDDHLGKSSTVAHQSEQALAASLIPSLYPANVQDIFDFTLWAYALSRYSGVWVGVKCVTDVVEQTMTVDVDLDRFHPIAPEDADFLSAHAVSGAYNPLAEEVVVLERRLPLVPRFVHSNAIDRVLFKSATPRLGIVTAGKAYGDVMAALSRLGLDCDGAAALGMSLYKVACIWPLEPRGLIDFASGHDVLLVIEEKKSFIEQQAATLLVNRQDRPLLIGKLDETGAALLSSARGLESTQIAGVLLERLKRLGLPIESLAQGTGETPHPPDASAPVPHRAPYFCSGCPHNRSTRIPEGSLSMTGIGCHTMVNFVRPQEALLPGQMGGEGANWIGMAPFTETKHIFQNLGDGTYFHSGLLAIRAAVAAGVNITYKILYNDAVAMTGGQKIDGPISIPIIVRQVASEGVTRIAIVSDAPERYAASNDLPGGIEVAHRDELERVQRAFREIPGCTVLIYEQTCAAEKRRRRKRRLYPDPPKRLFIAEEVCEGCGDCSVQSTCVSILPKATDFGRKREIDQASCNKDYSCLNGFCPSFITVYDGKTGGDAKLQLDPALFDALGTGPIQAVGDSAYNILLCGIGGTGVVTISALLVTAAHIDGLVASTLDQTGLAQKNGAVSSHVRIAQQASALTAQRLGAQEVDLLLAFDVLAALSADLMKLLSAARTRAVINESIAPTSAFQFGGAEVIDTAALIGTLQTQLLPESARGLDALDLAQRLLGDTVGTNMLMLGVALQCGYLPVSASALERAIELNGVAVAANRYALRLGRLFAQSPEQVLRLLAPAASGEGALSMDLDALLNRRAAHLTLYQNATLAQRYRSLVERVRSAERAVFPQSSILACSVATTYAKLLAYKDEYEVARLLTSPALKQQLRQTFGAQARIAFNLAPPVLAGKPVAGRPRKRELGSWLSPALGLLKHFKFLRGSALDPFSYHADRVSERALIVEYEQLIDELLPVLNESTFEAACELAGAAGEIRGFGPVKLAAIERYRVKVAALRRSLSELRNPRHNPAAQAVPA